MENLQLVLIAVGVIIILGVLIHGLVQSREKGNQTTYKTGNMPIVNQSQDEEQTATSSFDEYGIGPVRIVEAPPAANEDTQNVHEQEQAQTDVPSQDDQLDTQLSDEADLAEDNVRPVFQPVISQPKPERTIGSTNLEDDIPAPPAHLMVSLENEQGTDEQTADVTAPIIDVDNEDDSQVAEQQTNAQPENDGFSLSNDDKLGQTHPLPKTDNVKPSGLAGLFARKRSAKKEKNNDEQMQISFESVDPVLNEAAQNQQVDTDSKPVLSDFLALHVRFDNELSGASLLPKLLTLGFKFGKQKIFHRHVESNGRGPVLFSLANMLNPGVFDIDNMEQAQYLGLTLFMNLPMESDPHQVFNMMHNAAKKLSDEFGGKVLEQDRSVLTMQGLQLYVDRIRNFERQRLIARNDR